MPERLIEQGLLTKPGLVTPARTALWTALRDAGHHPRSQQRLVTAVNEIFQHCAEHGAGRRRGYTLAGRDDAIIVRVRQERRFTPHGMFPPRTAPAPGAEATEPWRSLLLIGPLLHGLARCRADDGGRLLTVEIPGGRRVWVVNCLHRWAAANGGYAPRYVDWIPPGHPQWDPVNWPVSSGAADLFGLWSTMLAAAGLNPPPRRRKNQLEP